MSNDALGTKGGLSIITANGGENSGHKSVIVTKDRLGTNNGADLSTTGSVLLDNTTGARGAANEGDDDNNNINIDVNTNNGNTNVDIFTNIGTTGNDRGNGNAR